MHSTLYYHSSKLRFCVRSSCFCCSQLVGALFSGKQCWHKYHVAGRRKYFRSLTLFYFHLQVIGDASPDASKLMKREGVRSVPSFHYFKNGEKVDVVNGANAEAIEAAITKNLA